jgi:hypothetical protein
MAVTMKNIVFWDVTPCGYYKNRRFGRTSVLIRATKRNTREDDILRHSKKNFKKEFHYTIYNSHFVQNVRSANILRELWL